MVRNEQKEKKKEPNEEERRRRATDTAFLAVKLNFIRPRALYNEINIKFPFVPSTAGL